MALATNSTPGSIVLAGDLTGTAGAPELRVSGVEPGEYTMPTIVVDAAGRVIYAKSRDYHIPFIGDAQGNEEYCYLINSGVTSGEYFSGSITIQTNGLMSSAQNSPVITITGGMQGTITDYSATATLSPTGITAGSYVTPELSVEANGLIRIIDAAPVDYILQGDATGQFNGNSCAVSLLQRYSTPTVYEVPPILTVNGKGIITAYTFEGYTYTGDLEGAQSGNLHTLTLKLTGVTPIQTTGDSIVINEKGLITSIVSDSVKLIKVGSNFNVSLAGALAIKNSSSTDFGLLRIDSGSTDYLRFSGGYLAAGYYLPKLNPGGTGINIFSKFVSTPVEVLVNDNSPYCSTFRYENDTQYFNISNWDWQNESHRNHFDVLLHKEVDPEEANNWIGLASNGTSLTCTMVSNNLIDNTPIKFAFISSNYGATWVPSALPVVVEGATLKWDGARFIVSKLGDRQTLVSSTDGVSWLVHNLGVTCIADMLVADSTYTYYIGVLESGNQIAIIDYNFINPTSIITLPVTAQWTRAYCFGSYFYLISSTGYILRSSNGSTWETMSTTTPLVSLAWSGTQFCGGTADGVLKKSADLITWTITYTAPQPNQSWVSIIWTTIGGNPTFIATSWSNTYYRYDAKSDVTGSTWEVRETYSGSAFIDSPQRPVIFNGNQLCYQAASSSKFYYSSNGLDWTATNNPTYTPGLIQPYTVTQSYNYFKFSNVQQPHHSMLSCVVIGVNYYCTFY